VLVGLAFFLKLLDFYVHQVMQVMQLRVSLSASDFSRAEG